MEQTTEHTVSTGGLFIASADVLPESKSHAV